MSIYVTLRFEIESHCKSQTSTYLSSDMLQLICVFLCVLTVMNGNSIAEFFDGTRPRSSASLLRVTKLLNETCCKISSRNCCCLLSMRSFRISISASKALHCCAELVGKPIQRISFLSLEMMFIAIRTFSASYTRRRMFF